MKNQQKILKKIIDQNGGQIMLAKKMNVTQQAVSFWFKSGVPPKRVRALLKLAPEGISSRDLRPDVFP